MNSLRIFTASTLLLFALFYSLVSLAAIPAHAAMQPPLVFNGCLFDESDVFVSLDNCNGQAELCLPFSYDVFNIYTITDNGVPYFGFSEACALDSVVGFGLPFLGYSTAFTLQNWQWDGATHTQSFDDIAGLVEALNTWDPTGGWQYNASLNLLYSTQQQVTYPDFTFLVGDTPYTVSPFVNQYTLGSTFRFVRGNHEVIFTKLDGSCSDTLHINVTCLETISFYESINLFQTDTLCVSFENLIAPLSPLQNTCPSSAGFDVNYYIPDDSYCVVFTGANVGTDTLCLEVCDAANGCGLAFVVVNVADPGLGVHRIPVTLATNTSDNFCINTNVLGSAVSEWSISCMPAAENFSISYDTLTHCVRYTAGSNPANDSVCMVVCDIFGNCDTTILQLSSTADINQFYYDDAIGIDFSGDYCFDAATVGGTISSLVADCSNGGSTFVLNTTTNCVTYTPVAAVTDTLCFYMTGANGDVDTVSLYITGIQSPPSFQTATVQAGQTLVFCTDNTDIYGENLTITNYCANNPAIIADFELSNDSTCVVVSGLSIGIDTACLVVCNGLHTCDTTYLIVTVTYAPVPVPFAVNDSFAVMENDFLQMNVLANDGILVTDSLISLRILSVPQGGLPQFYGVAIINDNSIIEYSPNLNVCGQTDSLTYEVCTQDLGCDTAKVGITILCVQDTNTVDPTAGVRVFNGFSPNGDNINDTFVIEHIENYPNSVLVIYNRWGNLVYEATGYRNDWRGTFNGKDLPDGIYFYYLRNAGRSRSGSLTILR